MTGPFTGGSRAILPASLKRIADPGAFAATLADFLSALQRIDPSSGPPAGAHSFYRGGPLATYDAETQRTIEILKDDIDAKAAAAVWETALTAAWHGPPV